MNTEVTGRARLRWSQLGPGILYAGAAVGISHLVQATRAGANYYLAMTAAIIVACAIKYPALRFGGEYAAATGKSLIENYRDRGRVIFYSYALAQILTMPFAVAAVTIATAGLLKATLGLGISDLAVTAILLGGCAVLLLSGKYRMLEMVTKAVVVLFTVLIVITIAVVISRIHVTPADFLPAKFNAQSIAFVVALMGFMPSPMDACVIQSLWTRQKARLSATPLTPAQSRLDFNIGFGISVILALAFMLLGAAVMYGSGQKFAQDPAGFANQVISLFTATIGSWAYPIIGVAAAAVMLSTLMTLLDAYPRVIEALVLARWPERSGKLRGMPVYDVAVVGLIVAVLMVLALFMSAFAAFIDLAALIVFVTGPLYAWLNHSAMLGPDVPPYQRPGRFMRSYSMAGIGAMVALLVIYFSIRAGG
ncbi:MAG: hypothetical protein R3E77_14945 [Steroidobacteraceae bacterium]